MKLSQQIAAAIVSLTPLSSVVIAFRVEGEPWAQTSRSEPVCFNNPKEESAYFDSYHSLPHSRQAGLYHDFGVSTYRHHLPSLPQNTPQGIDIHGGTIQAAPSLFNQSSCNEDTGLAGYLFKKLSCPISTMIAALRNGKLALYPIVTRATGSITQINGCTEVL
jgi:hypothetical protein